MKKKGFTLIELLAVIIILAIVALIATPIVLNVIEDAKKSAGNSEANMVLKGITDYCEQENMGIAKTNYCTNGQMSQENIEKIINPGKATNIKVTITNGKVTDLTLNSNGHDFQLNNGKMEESNGTKPVSQGNLINTLLEANKGKIGKSDDVNAKGLVQDVNNANRYFYRGTSTEVANNFLWFGGHQWRILEFNTQDKTLKLITQQPLTTIQPAQAVWTDASTYENTYINKWLNNYFYNSLSESARSKLIKSDYNIIIPELEDKGESGGGGPRSAPMSNHKLDNNLQFLATTNNTTSQYVGLLDQVEYTNAGGTDSYLDIKDYFWLQNRASSSSVRVVSYDGSLNYGIPSSTDGVRAVITISDITIHEGDGTLKQNYKVSEKVNNTSLVQVGDYIKVPYEESDNACGSDNKCMFRVVSKDNDSIKVVLNGLLPTESAYGDTSTITPSYTIYTSLNNFANGINDEYQYTTNKKFNIGIYDDGKSYESLSGETIEANIGLPVVGEMFSGNDIDVNTDPKTFVDTDLIENPTASDWYWTMNRYDSSYVRIVDYDGGLYYNYGLPSIAYGVRAVIFLKAGQASNLPFTAGDGSPSSPYELKSIEPKQ